MKPTIAKFTAWLRKSLAEFREMTHATNSTTALIYRVQKKMLADHETLKNHTMKIRSTPSDKRTINTLQTLLDQEKSEHVKTQVKLDKLQQQLRDETRERIGLSLALHSLRKVAKKMLLELPLADRELDELREQAKHAIEQVQLRPHEYWYAGQAGCPRELKAGGEIHTLRCKVCGKEKPALGPFCTGTPNTAGDDAIMT